MLLISDFNGALGADGGGDFAAEVRRPQGAKRAGVAAAMISRSCSNQMSVLTQVAHVQKRLQEAAGVARVPGRWWDRQVREPRAFRPLLDLGWRGG